MDRALSSPQIDLSWMTENPLANLARTSASQIPTFKQLVLVVQSVRVVPKVEAAESE